METAHHPIRIRASVILACSSIIWAAAATPTHAGHSRVDRYLASLNDPTTQAALGIVYAERPTRAVNRLEIIFEEGMPATARQRVLRRIAHELLKALLRYRGIPTVTVVERSATSDRELNRVVTNVGHIPLLIPRNCD